MSDMMDSTSEMARAGEGARQVRSVVAEADLGLQPDLDIGEAERAALGVGAHDAEFDGLFAFHGIPPFLRNVMAMTRSNVSIAAIMRTL
jgi:hypothetical protein